MDNERIIELETRLSFVEHHINEISDVIAQQAQQIDRLQQINEKLVARVRELAESGKSKTGVDEKPPHY